MSARPASPSDREPASLGAVFARDGLVRVPDAIPSSELAAMQAELRGRLATLEVVEIAGARRPARGTELAMWDVGRAPAFARLAEALGRAVDRVFGPGVFAPVDGELGGLAIPNLPGRDATWSACALAWHVDEPTPPGPAPGDIVLAYAFLDRVEPGGGATVVLAGSHRRLAHLADERAAPITYEDAPGALAAAEPWFAALLREPAAITASCDSAGVALHLVELTGEPGDLVLLHPRCLHTISANVSPRPRLVMRLTCLRTARE